jgi:hypothetical protein
MTALYNIYGPGQGSCHPKLHMSFILVLWHIQCILYSNVAFQKMNNRLQGEFRVKILVPSDPKKRSGCHIISEEP